jgi:hypothetical protein
MRSLGTVTDHDEMYFDALARPLGHEATGGDIGVIGVGVDGERGLGLKPEGAHG